MTDEKIEVIKITVLLVRVEDTREHERLEIVRTLMPPIKLAWFFVSIFNCTAHFRKRDSCIASFEISIALAVSILSGLSFEGKITENSFATKWKTACKTYRQQ